MLKGLFLVPTNSVGTFSSEAEFGFNAGMSNVSNWKACGFPEFLSQPGLQVSKVGHPWPGFMVYSNNLEQGTCCELQC